MLSDFCNGQVALISGDLLIGWFVMGWGRSERGYLVTLPLVPSNVVSGHKSHQAGEVAPYRDDVGAQVRIRRRGRKHRCIETVVFFRP